MVKSPAILMTLFSLFHCMVQELTPDPDCWNKPGTSRTLKLTMNSKRNQTGEWVDTFAAQTETSKSSDSMNLDVTHRVTECEGRRVIYIQGVSNALPVDVHDDRLLFHPRCGKNIAILNKGLTVQKINEDDAFNSVVFTNRPLKDDEIFEIRLDKKLAKHSYSLGIGIITSTPNDVNILPEMWKSPDAKIYHQGSIFSNGAEIVKNYGKVLNQLPVGDRVGVMRSEFGTLHFFVNGVDQGPAASNIPSPVYGLFELWYNAAKATIVDASLHRSS